MEKKQLLTTILASTLTALTLSQTVFGKEPLTPITNCTDSGCVVGFQNTTDSILPGMNIYTPYKSGSNVVDQANSTINQNFWTTTSDDKDIDGIDGTNQGSKFNSTHPDFNIGNNDDVSINIPFIIDPQMLILANGWMDAGGVVEAMVGSTIIDSAPVRFPNPYSTDTIAVTGPGTVTATDVDTGAGDNVGERYLEEPKTYTATPDTGYEATWDTDTCDVVDGDNCTNNTIGPHAPSVVFTAIPPIKFTATAGVLGENGTLTAPGIDCPGDCSEEYNDGSTQTFTANPNTNYVGTWGGDCLIYGTDPTCPVVMDADKTVTIQYNLIPPTMWNLEAIINGNGNVTGLGGLDGNAGQTMVALEEGSNYTVVTEPDVGHKVTGIAGHDEIVNVDDAQVNNILSDRTVNVFFGPYSNGLSVGLEGSGSGQVRSALGDIDTSAGNYIAARSYGDGVILTATVADGSTFAGWSGCNDAQELTCYQTLDQNVDGGLENVTAQFDLDGSKVEKKSSVWALYMPVILSSAKK